MCIRDRLKRIVPTKKAEALRAEILENIRVMEKRLTKGISEEEFSMCMCVSVSYTHLDVYKRQVEKRRSRMRYLSTKQIQEIIPHRHPFLLIDKIEDYVPGEYAIGYKGVSYHEDFFRGHFPQKAVMPGVLILEALAQTGAVAILSVPENQGKIAFFGGVQKCRFKGMVFPGDQLKLETKIIKRKGPVGVGEAVATVNGKVVVTAELTFMVGE